MAFGHDVVHQTLARAAPQDTPANIGNQPKILIAICALFLVLTWVSVSLRIWVRAVMLRSFGADDWLMVLTLLVCTAGSATVIVISDYEMNQDIQKLYLADRLMGYIYAYFGLYIASMFFLKFSLAIFFMRIVIKQWQRWTLWISFLLYGCFAVAYWAIAIFQCGNPVHSLGRRFRNECLSFENIVGPLGYAHASLNAVTDWIFALLPIFVLQLSELPMRSRVPIIALLVLAALGSISSCVRLAYIEDLAPGNQFFVRSIKINMWSVVEPGLGITAASLATLRPMFRCLGERARSVVNPSFLSSSRRSRPNSPAPAKGSMSIVRELGITHVGRGGFPPRGFLEDPESATTITTVLGNSSEIERAQPIGLDATYKSYGHMHSGRHTARQQRPESYSSRSETGSYHSLHKAPSTRSVESAHSIPQRQSSSRSHVSELDATRPTYQNRAWPTNSRAHVRYDRVQNNMF